MHEVRLEVQDQETLNRHREAITSAEQNLEEYIDDFKRRDRTYGPRPAPTGKFAPRRISTASHAYIDYHQRIIRANNDLFTRVINALHDRLNALDVGKVEDRLANLNNIIGTHRSDVEDAVSQLSNEVGAAQQQALEAIDLLKDAHARMDELEEELDELA